MHLALFAACTLFHSALLFLFLFLIRIRNRGERNTSFARASNAARRATLQADADANADAAADATVATFDSATRLWQTHTHTQAQSAYTLTYVCVCVWWRDRQRWRPAHRQAHASGPNTDAGDKVDVGCVVVVVAVVYRCLSFAVPSFCVLFLFILCVCFACHFSFVDVVIFCSFVSFIRFAAAG